MLYGVVGWLGMCGLIVIDGYKSVGEAMPILYN